MGINDKQTLGLLAFSTLLVGGSSVSPQLQVIVFLISLYLVAFAQSGHKPCVQVFGADQFDADNTEERKAKSSFFNWWYFGTYAGPTIGIFVLSYIQDNFSWALGFGIPCIIMGFALIIFLLGTGSYRFEEKTEVRNGFVRIGQCILNGSDGSNLNVVRFLNKALVTSDGSNEDGIICTIDEVEEAKAFLRLIPIWTSCLA
ncbi:protein NRT1/ PTR FAMILY 5.10-like [Rutidosis leptorrhynchoides]|uniref:protein NRT1/ PTR FAMILY 5.10-like n=1 Tax=Rutidosis leptorrhynchoides TaxID=125765 RepID=UPI003A99AD96